MDCKIGPEVILSVETELFMVKKKKLLGGKSISLSQSNFYGHVQKVASNDDNAWKFTTF